MPYAEGYKGGAKPPLSEEALAPLWHNMRRGTEEVESCGLRHDIPSDKKIFEEEDVRERAGQRIKEICDDYAIEIEEIELAGDHVHLLVSFPPKPSKGEMVRIIKSTSARELFREFPRIKKRLWAGELWEDGYFARTVGDRMTRQIIEKYINHHRAIEQRPAQLF